MCGEKTMLVVALVLVGAFTVPLMASGTDEEVSGRPIEISWGATAKWDGVTGKETAGKRGDWEAWVLGEFGKSNPAITVKLDVWPASGNEMNQKFALAVASSTLPDMLTVSAYLARENAMRKQAAPIDDVVENPADFYPAAYDASLNEGKHYYIPLYVSVIGMIVNKTMFDKAGIALPKDPDRYWTFEEYYTAVKKQKEALPGVSGFTYQTTYPTNYIGWFNSNNAFFLSPDRRTFVLGDSQHKAAAVETIRRLQKLIADGLAYPGIGGPENSPSELFYKQSISNITGAWDIWYGRALGRMASGQIQKFDMYWALQPGDRKWSTMPAHVLQVVDNGNAGKLKAAQRLFRFVTSGPILESVPSGIGMSPRKSSLPKFDQSPDHNIRAMSRTMAFADRDELENHPVFSSVRVPMTNVAGKIAARELTPEQALDRFVAECTPVVQKYWQDFGK